MALSAFDSIRPCGIWDSFPGHVVTDHFRLSNFSNRFIVQATDQERSEITSYDCGALTGCWGPL